MSQETILYSDKTEHINTLASDEKNYRSIDSPPPLKAIKELLIGKILHNITTYDLVEILFYLKKTSSPIEIEISYTKYCTSKNNCILMSVRKFFYIHKKVSSSAVDFRHLNSTLIFYANSKKFNLILEKNGLFWLREQLN